MTERTPNLSTIRHAWAKAHPFPLTTDVEERYAEFDRWLAAHDAEKRAEWEAEQGEVEWEYATEADEETRTTTRPRGPRILFDGVPYPPEMIEKFVHGRRVRRRKAGPWVPVNENGETP